MRSKTSYTENRERERKLKSFSAATGECYSTEYGGFCQIFRGGPWCRVHGNNRKFNYHLVLELLSNDNNNYWQGASFIFTTTTVEDSVSETHVRSLSKSYSKVEVDSSCLIWKVIYISPVLYMFENNTKTWSRWGSGLLEIDNGQVEKQVEELKMGKMGH